MTDLLPLFLNIAGRDVVLVGGGPVAAGKLRQLLAAITRSAPVISTCTSLAASVKVLGDTSGPTGGAVPNAGGAPGGSSAVCCF